MDVRSPAFKNGEDIPSKYTCDGEDILPPLEISDVPSNTKSLAVIVEDPDVPSSVRADGMWDHCLIWDISPDTTTINEGELPNDTAVLGNNTGGEQGYMGPCPPDREHRYFFRLYALDTNTLGLEAGASKDNLLSAMQGHIIDQAELMGVYERS